MAATPVSTQLHISSVLELPTQTLILFRAARALDDALLTEEIKLE